MDELKISRELAFKTAEFFAGGGSIPLIFAERYHGKSRNPAGQHLLGVHFQESGRYQWFRDGGRIFSIPENHLRISYSSLERCSAEPEADNYLWAFAFDMSSAKEQFAEFLNIPMPSVKLHNVAAALALFQKIGILFHHQERSGRLYSLRLHAAVIELFTLAARAFMAFRGTAPDDITDKVEKFLWLNFADSKLSRESIAARFNFSPSYLNKKFIAAKQQTILQFLNKLRLERAGFLLENSSLRISEVAWSVGFNDPLYFSRCFLKYYGKSPGKYKKALDKTPKSK